MTAIPQVQAHPASIDAYIRFGWSLVPIPAGTKGPRTAGWNLKPNALKSQADLPLGNGIGLAHAYSGTMALDIDDWDTTAMLLGLRGIDIQALYDANDAVHIESGRAGHGKLLYAMPLGLALPSKKILLNGATAYELRCATANGLTVQDVLPPSIHPDTKQPYCWAGKGHWMRLPTIPQPLLDLWQEMLDQDKVRNMSTNDGVDASWSEIASALEAVSPDVSREEWVNIGMALHWAGTHTNQLDQALSLWDEWSKPSSKYPGEKGIITQWVSFKSDKATSVKLGTLFHIAKQHGWTRPLPDVSSYFSQVVAATPEDVYASFRPTAPDIDFSLFPKVLVDRSVEIAEAMGADPLVPLWAGLAAVSGAVDAQSRLELLPGYKVPPVLWVMTIGDPAQKKSPATDPMLRVFPEIEKEHRPQYKKDLLDWEGKEAAYASAKKAFLEFSASPEAMLSGDQAPSVPEMPAPPVETVIVVSDVTSQKVVRVVADRPRGVLCHLDEMAGWIAKLTDPRSGDDRSTWVQSYEAKHYRMDRVGSGSIHCENFAISIVGNIQPAVYRENLRKMAADGLLQRFIPVVLRRRRWKRGNVVPEYLSHAAQWDNALRVAYALPSMTYRLSEEAEAEFVRFQDWYDDQKQDEYLLNSDETFLQAFGKLEGTTGRLIFIFHLLENPFSPIVDVDVVRRVIKLVRTFIVPSFRYALSEVGGESSFDTWMSDYVIQHCDAGMVTLSELKRAARRQLKNYSSSQAEQMVLTAMHLLEKSNWVVRLDDGSREHQHFAQWVIDPNLAVRFKKHREEVIRAKQRQRDEIYKLSTKEKPRVHGADDLDD
jgi:hypothetical protein